MADTFVLLPVFFVFGLAIGSFINVAVVRGGRGEKLGGRSYCESCKATLSVQELWPVISFVFQKGRCRHCGSALSWQDPLVELGTGLAYAAAAWILEINIFSLVASGQYFLKSLLTFAGIAAVTAILVSDLRYRLIPNGAVLLLALTGIGFYFLTPGTSNFSAFLNSTGLASTLALFLASLWLISRGRLIGLGDAKLIFATSLLAGYPDGIAAFLFSFWLGGIAGIMLILSGRKSLKDQIPFGPFILLGTALAYFFSKTFFYLTGLEGIL